MNVEEIRTWLCSQRGRWPAIAEAIDYPYSSLQKFAQGQVNEPRLKKLQALADYMSTHRASS